MSVAKACIKLDWKSFNVNLALVLAQVKFTAGENCCGLQAANQLEVWFLEEPTEEVKSAIIAYWDGLIETSEEAVKYFSQTALQAKIAELKASAVLKAWDEMTVPERKIVSGMQVTAEEVGLI